MSNHGAHNDSQHHDHDHDHGHDHGHDHSDEVEPALQSLIWNQIEFEKIRTLNEHEVDAGAKIVEKTWPQRLDPEPELVSDSDEQLLMFIPYVTPHFIIPFPFPPRTLQGEKNRKKTQNPISQIFIPLLLQVSPAPSNYTRSSSAPRTPPPRLRPCISSSIETISISPPPSIRSLRRPLPYRKPPRSKRSP